MFAAFLSVELRPQTDRYGDKTTKVVLPLSRLTESEIAMCITDREIAHAIHTLAESPIVFTSASLVVNAQTVKVSLTHLTRED